MTPDKIAEQLRQDASAYSQGFADGYRLAKRALIMCKDCKHSEPWYRDRRRCFLWDDGGVSVWHDGFCNYAERKEE